MEFQNSRLLAVAVGAVVADEEVAGSAAVAGDRVEVAASAVVDGPAVVSAVVGEHDRAEAAVWHGLVVEKAWHGQEGVLHGQEEEGVWPVAEDHRLEALRLLDDRVVLVPGHQYLTDPRIQSQVAAHDPIWEVVETSAAGGILDWAIDHQYKPVIDQGSVPVADQLERVLRHYQALVRVRELVLDKV